MNRPNLMKTTFIILLLTLSLIGGSNQAAQALNYTQEPSNEEVQQVATEPAQDLVGLQDTTDSIEIWIVQDFVITIYDLALIECHVLNLYAIEIEADIEVWIQYDNGSVFLIYQESRILFPYLEYVFNVTHAFTLVGFHLVNLKVMDITNNQEVTTECQWEVRDGYLELAIIQEYEAQVGIEVKMEFYIYNGYPIAREYFIEVFLNDGTGPILIHNETTIIAAYDVLIIVIYWTFLVSGHYDVVLRVTDVPETFEWFDYCYWEVYDGFIDIRIEQNYEAWIGVEERIQFWVYNYYAIDITAEISVFIDNGTHTYQIYFRWDVVINAGTYFMDEVFYTFIYEGSWDLYVEVFVIEYDVTWIEYCPEGWYVYGGSIDVWIHQQLEAFVLEEAIMYCWIQSNYAVDRDITIEVWIHNATHSILIYSETYLLLAGEIYYFTVLWTFLHPDYWEVEFVVLDIISDTFFTRYCRWNVYGGYFELNIIQDYYALVYEDAIMRFEVYNYYNVEKEVTIEILIFDGEDYLHSYHGADIINPMSFWILDWYHYFEEAGYYDVILIVTEVETQTVWIETCWWQIFTEYMDLWIIQDFTAQVGEEVLMEFYIFNYYANPMDLTVNVWVDDGTSSDLIYTNSIIIPANGVFNFTVLYSFLAEGSYTVELEVIDNATGAHWFKYCPWRIFTGYIDVWIDQDYDAVVGQEVWMQFYILNHYSFDVQIYIEVQLDTGNGTVVLFSDSMMILLAYQTWMLNISYTFTNPGVYQVYFIVLELQTGIFWTEECRWYIHDDGWLDIWIEQGFYGDIGVTYTMQFGVGNLYSIDKNLNLVVKIVQGADSWIAHNETKLVLSLTTYDFYVYWIFVNEGWYDVYFIVTDVTTGIVKIEDCWWQIVDPTVIPEFGFITLMPILGALFAAVYLAFRRRRKLTH